MVGNKLKRMIVQFEISGCCLVIGVCYILQTLYS
jgi:hypothetical protein